MSARIYQRPKNAMQSGRARTQEWVLEFAPSEARRPDPLMGWAGSGDTQVQVVLTFGFGRRGQGLCRQIRHSRPRQHRAAAPPEATKLRRQFPLTSDPPRFCEATRGEGDRPRSGWWRGKSLSVSPAGCHLPICACGENGEDRWRLAKSARPRHIALRESGGRLLSPTWSGPEGSSHNDERRVGRLLQDVREFRPGRAANRRFLRFRCSRTISTLRAGSQNRQFSLRPEQNSHTSYASYASPPMPFIVSAPHCAIPSRAPRR